MPLTIVKRDGRWQLLALHDEGKVLGVNQSEFSPSMRPAGSVGKNGPLSLIGVDPEAQGEIATGG